MRVIIAIFALLAVAACAEVPTVSLNRMFLNTQINFHYEDPFQSSHKPVCSGEGETVNQIEGVSDFYMCNPKALGVDYVCAFDFPPGTTAKPKAKLTDQEGDVRCALVCHGPASGHCSGRAQCMIVPGDDAEMGFCVYPKR